MSVALLSSFIFDLECLKRKHDTAKSRECGYNSISKSRWKSILDNYLRPITDSLKISDVESGDVGFFENAITKVELWSSPGIPEEFKGESSGFAARKKAVLIDCVAYKSLNIISESNEYFNLKSFVVKLLLTSDLFMVSQTTTADLEKKIIPLLLRLPLHTKSECARVLKFVFKRASSEQKVQEIIDLMCLSSPEILDSIFVMLFKEEFYDKSYDCVVDMICTFLYQNI